MKWQRIPIPRVKDWLVKLTEPVPIPGLRIENDHMAGFPDALEAALVRLGYNPNLTAPKWQDIVLGNARILDGSRDYQEKGMRWLLNVLGEVRGALLADDMGLGKTMQALAIADVLTDDSDTTPPGRVLVACPAAARETWLEQVEKWMPDTGVAVFRGDGKVPKNAETARIVVSSYDLLIDDNKVVNVAFPYTQPRILIMDEAHRLKGRTAQRSKALLVRARMSEYRLALTGTPVDDRPRDLFMLLDILFGKRFGNQYEFDKAYCGGKQGEHGWENKGSSNEAELHRRLLWYMLRREKQEVAGELPPLSRTIRWLDPQPKAKAELDRLRMGLTSGSMHRALLATLEGKMDEAVQLACEAKRFLLFTYRRDHARVLWERIRAELGGCAIITGDLSAEQRQKVINGARVNGAGLVATLDSASEALNLQGIASQGIFHAFDWRPRVLAQAEARLHRLGQAEPVQWTYLATRESADMLVMKTVVDKLDAIIATMGAKAVKGLRNDVNADDGGGKLDMDALRRMTELLSEEQED